MKTRDTVPSIGNILFIGAFLAVCLFSWIDFFFKIDPTPPLQENRQLAALPPFHPGLTAINNYPANFNAYFDDNFGFRSLLIQAYSRITLQGLRTPSNPAVILGKDNWFFLAGHYGLEYYRSQTLFSPAELDQWKTALEQDRDLLRSRGIRFLIVIAPNKDTIYPEYMPDYIVRYRQESRLDQWLDFLGGNSDLDILDLRPVLIQAKGEDLLYDRSDTHWNGRGAYLAYQSIVRRAETWFPQLEPLSADDFSFQSVPGAGDLIALLGLGNAVSDQIVDAVQITPSRASPTEYEIPPSDNPLPTSNFLPDIYQIDDPTLPRVVIFHDSFANRLMPLLSQNFRRTAFFQSEYYLGYEKTLSILNREQPDLVIYEFAERSLQFPDYYFRIEE